MLKILINLSIILGLSSRIECSVSINSVPHDGSSKLAEVMKPIDRSQLNSTGFYITPKFTISTGDANKLISFVANEQLYSERNCKIISNRKGNVTLNGSITDNAITFQEDISKDFQGVIQIYPDPHFLAFNVFIGVSVLSDGVLFQFSNNQMQCKNQEDNFNSNSNKVEGRICVETTKMKRQPNTLSACFIIGGAVLNSKFYDINTINTYTGLSGMMVDFGCYNATLNAITYSNQGDLSDQLSSSLNAIVKSLRLCNSSSSPNISYILSLVLVGVLSLLS